ncbi:DUF3515 domain-containing protein [Streptomyces tubbatahanensis]|uniref:DUF3515 domain-containing protein n=1 Tax=Streptomyces tubbatahanensis TaxID=2923272 RepID=UPI00311B2608
MRIRRRACPRSVPVRYIAACGLAAVAASACSVTGDAGPTPPSPSGKAAQACRTLHDALPEKVVGQQRGEAEPASDYTAVWGDPALALRCGVPRPARLTPGNEEYNPTTEAAEVNGVSWMMEKRDDGYRFTTTERAVYIELTVPDDYAPEVSPLADLSEAVKRSVPKKKS